MIKEPRIRLLDLVACLADAIDLVSPALVDHHNPVAYIAFSLARELGLPTEKQKELMLAGALHDCGALCREDILESLQFESGFGAQHLQAHAERGYLLLKVFAPFSSVAKLVRFHHVYWNEGRGSEFNGQQVPKDSHVLHLAERLSTLVNKEEESLGQVEKIRQRIIENSGRMFAPEVVDAFTSLSTREYFWFDLASPKIGSILSRRISLSVLELDMEGLLSLGKLFSHIIDFRSRFTATHSSGVAASAEALAGLAGFGGRECQMMRLAGYLHDLGKLVVPPEILGKPGKLTKGEFNVIRSHSYHTYRTLERISDLDVINAWASFHHERLDGSGYPFHHKGEDLSLGSRIMAVADVFTAITEDRPYRDGMNKDAALVALRHMADKSALDSNMVSVLELHYDEVNTIRMSAQKAAYKAYKGFGLSGTET